MSDHLVKHPSEIKGSCLMKCFSEKLQDLPYFWNTKVHIVTIYFSIWATLFYSLKIALVYVDIDQGFH